MLLTKADKGKQASEIHSCGASKQRAPFLVNNFQKLGSLSASYNPTTYQSSSGALTLPNATAALEKLVTQHQDLKIMEHS